VESNDDITTDTITDSKNWLDRNGDLDNPHVSEDEWEVDDASDLMQDNGI
jgi:hypothetical protein